MQPSAADVIAPVPTDLAIPEVHDPTQSESPVPTDSKVEVNQVTLGVDTKDLALAKSGRKQVSLSDKKDALRLLGARNDGSFGVAQLQPETSKKWSNKAVADRYGVSKATVTGWKNASRKIMRADTGHGRVGKKVRMRDSPFASLEAALHAALKDDHCGSGNDDVKMDAVRTRARGIRDEMVGRLKIQMRIVNDEKKRNEMRKEIQVLEGFRTSAGWTQKFIERHKYFRMREMDQEQEEEEQERKEREENEREVKAKLGQLKKYQDAAVGFRVEICAIMGDRSMISDAKAHSLLASVDMELERVAKLLERAHQRGRL